MMNYADIVKRGGNELRKANREFVLWVRDIEDELTAEAMEVIDSTPYFNMLECFGMCKTAEELNDYILTEYY